MYNDSLYRVSFKCLVRNNQGEVMVVKEKNRSSWDLPGGGIDYGETVQASIQRELKEEINYQGNFTYEVLAIDDPFKLQTRDVWQIKVILNVQLDSMEIGVGDDADEVAFIDPGIFKNSEHGPEQQIYRYSIMQK